MKPCARKLDPADAEAVASGEEPLFAADAAAHAASCPECGAAVSEAGRIVGELTALAAEALCPADFASRIVRLRPFSRRERLSVSLWAAPAAFAAGLLGAGLGMLGLPGLSGQGQIGLGAAALLPVAGIFRSLVGWLEDLRHAAPAGLESLSEALRHEQALGVAAALLFVPIALGLRRVLANARR
ncbi:MAG: hypothetical protein ACRD1B_01080 [Thermoanaerobaculia bacterium]